MKYKDIEIPQAALDAGNAAMDGDSQDGKFRSHDIQGAVSRVLRTMEEEKSFDYGVHNKMELDMRVADRLIQKARKQGVIRFNKGSFWTKVGESS